MNVERERLPTFQSNPEEGSVHTLHESLGFSGRCAPYHVVDPLSGRGLDGSFPRGRARIDESDKKKSFLKLVEFTESSEESVALEAAQDLLSQSGCASEFERLTIHSQSVLGEDPRRTHYVILPDRE